MGFGLAGIAGSAVEYALDGLSLRHTAIAANIANANSVGYRPQRVGFEEQLAGALALGTTETLGQKIGYLPPPLLSSDMPVADAMRRSALETEIVQLNQNTLQYQALVKGFDKYLSTIATAITEGRR